MRIWAVTNGIKREAYKVGGTAFKCFPSSNNEISTAREFSSLEEAAIFLIENTGWGIRMNPGASIIYNNIQIELD
ncbi:hypothetical protein [Aureimonas altamirensis]|uniref:hypothetical protein n=1 Tax=Aureimonas altamirensis TaxID=370622 RepID=UPI0012E0654C|nr:hypothetical protein [Aureimonas altamirensis]